MRLLVVHHRRRRALLLLLFVFGDHKFITSRTYQPCVVYAL